MFDVQNHLERKEILNVPKPPAMVQKNHGQQVSCNDVDPLLVREVQE